MDHVHRRADEARMPVVLITGASSGIGAATAILFGSLHHEVVLVGRHESRLQDVAAQIRGSGGQAHILVLDLANSQHAQRAIAETVKTCGTVDVVVNCAGISGGKSIQTAGELVSEIININLLAPIQLMSDAVQVFDQQGHGAIVNVGSVAGEIGVRGIYSASKFGLRGVTDSCRREVRSRNIVVSLVEPGRINAPGKIAPLRLATDPETVARAIVQATRRSHRRLIVPRHAGFVVLFSKVFPGIVDLISSRD